MIQDDATGLYNMFAARICGHCGLEHWYPKSEIVRATASSALGPFEVQEVVRDAFAHGPTIHKNPKGGFLLFHLGCAAHNGTIANCSGPTKTTALTPTPLQLQGQSYCNPDWIAVSLAPTLGGPWTLHGPIIEATNWTWFGGGVTNPAPYVFPNGSVLVMYRGHKPEKLGASFSDSFEGPYHAVGAVPLFEDADEDPYIWRNSADGIFHGVTHWMGKSSGVGGGGRHIWSEDGLIWKVSTALAYHTLVQWDDGNSTQATSRERPQLLVENGTPLVLYNGLQPSGKHNSGKTFTLAQPINQEQ